MTAAERAAAALAAGFAAAMVLAYFVDRAGLTIPPPLILILSLAAAGACWRRLPPDVDRGAIFAFAGVVLAVLASLLWLAWPDLLPIGAGSDLTHHLQLIAFIDEHWRLPHDSATVELIGNMVNYTPGSHLLAAMAGSWLRSDGLHAVYPVLAVSMALKAGMVFLIARHVLPAGEGRTPWALSAVILLALPYDYSLGSFVRWSFYAQVVSETCAVAMWLMLALWDRRPNGAIAFVFGLAGAGAYLAWPVWVGPPILALALMLVFRGELTVRRRVLHVSLALAPIAVAAALHATGRLESVAIVRTGGSAFELSAPRFGWVLLTLTCIGGALALRRREARSTLVVFAAIVLQTIALFEVARASGADSPYMARKMAHLAILPMSVLSALALASACQAASRRMAPIARALPPARLAWTVLIVVAVAAARVVSTMPRHAPVITEDLFRAGAWARDHAPRACVDYLVRSDDTSYWLHHAVLGNPMRPPAGAPAPVFFYRDAIARWLAGRGLPFAIADLSIVPREVREEIQPMARSGSIVAGPHPRAERCASQAIGSATIDPSKR